jgi:hypothetical protein
MRPVVVFSHHGGRDDREWNASNGRGTSRVVEYRVKQHGKVKHRERPVAEWVKALQILRVA